MAPKGRATRPTPDRVREALFSILGDVNELSVLDLFAGTGAVALEALSRGARRAVCVERARPALAALRANAKSLGALDRLQIRAEDVLGFVRGRPETFDLVFADPPWAEVPDFASTFETRASAWVAPGGSLIIERNRRDPVSLAWSGFEAPHTRTYGDAALDILERSTDES